VLLEQVNPPNIAAQRVEALVAAETSDSFQIEAPLSAALVRNPLRRLWPA
jgi:hypothetical protein